MRAALLLIPLAACARARMPEVTQVTAFSMNANSPGNPRCLAVYGPSGALCQDLDARTVTLSPGEQARLEALLADPASWTDSAEGCFTPRHAFVWTNPTGQRRRQLAVSLGCGVAYMDPPDKSFAIQNERLGLSRAGVEGLRELCMAIELPACGELERPE